MKKFKVLLLGFGSIGRQHGRVIQESHQCRLAAVVDNNPETEASIELLSDKPRYYSHLGEVKELSSFDFAIIATPTEFHFDNAKTLFKLKIPLLIEKPLASNLQQVIELCKIATETDIPLACGLLERFNPAILTVRPLVRDPLFILSTRHSPSTKRIKSGVRGDLLIHDTDLILSFMKKSPQRIEIMDAFGSNSYPLSKTEDTSSLIMLFDEGKHAMASVSRKAQHKTRKFTILEEERTFEIDLLRRTISIYRNLDERVALDGRSYEANQSVLYQELITHTEPLVAQLNWFIDYFVDRSKSMIENHLKDIVLSHQIIYAK